MVLAVALFDLDNTLLAGDSDYEWGCFLADQGVVDREQYLAANRHFYQQYQAGTLDIQEFLAFQLHPLTQHDAATLQRLRAAFVEERIRPIVLPAARELVERHRAQGDVPVIITATNRFITEPVAALLGVEHLLATEPEYTDGRYTGRVAGTPCFQGGKVERLQAWLDAQGLDWPGSWFYSDSHNDLPLLERVDHPVAVDPDPVLARRAWDRCWPVISLREAGRE